jgi:DNA-binding SARP family transcriptional activator
VVGNQGSEVPMQTLQIALFAKLDIRCGDLAITKLPAKAEELLCYLLLLRGQPHTREALAGELWADAPAAQSKKYLRQCLWQLQQALDPPAPLDRAPLLRFDHAWVVLHPDAKVLDDHSVCHFSTLCVEKWHTMEKKVPLCRRRKALTA